MAVSTSISEIPSNSGEAATLTGRCSARGTGKKKLFYRIYLLLPKKVPPHNFYAVASPKELLLNLVRVETVRLEVEKTGLSYPANIVGSVFN